MRAVIDDIGVDVVKTGMLGDAPTIEAVADVMAGLDGHVPIVIDPVMVAKGGASLLAEDAVNTLKRRLLPRATLVTPNRSGASRVGNECVSTCRSRVSPYT